MKRLIQQAKRREKRKLRIRSVVKGTEAMPRLSVFKSNKHFSAQAIDDQKGVTLAAITDMEKDLKITVSNAETVKKLGLELGKRLKEKNITTVVFDRNGFVYHGVIKSFADAVREAGIKF